MSHPRNVASSLGPARSRWLASTLPDVVSIQAHGSGGSSSFPSLPAQIARQLVARSRPAPGSGGCGCSITASTNTRFPDRVTVSKKSQAKRPSAWDCRKLAQVVAERPGTGSIPASFKISYTVEGATFTPSTSSSPCTRRLPHAGFSRTRRRTEARMEHTVPAQHRVGAYQQAHPAEGVRP
jgi:hypothetical protein